MIHTTTSSTFLSTQSKIGRKFVPPRPDTLILTLSPASYTWGLTTRVSNGNILILLGAIESIKSSTLDIDSLSLSSEIEPLVSIPTTTCPNFLTDAEGK